MEHEQNSGINFITVMGSKSVLIASTAAEVSSLLQTKRYSSDAGTKIEIFFPQTFHLYNRFMGGIDVHDGHWSNVLPNIRSKKFLTPKGCHIGSAILNITHLIKYHLRV